MSRKDDIPLFNMDLPEHRKLVVDYVKGLRGIVRLEVTRPRKHKTLSQLAYIWGVCYPTLAGMLSEAWGEVFDSERAHNVLKGMFLSRPVINRNTGEEMASEPRSLADLTVDECSAYIEALINFGAGMGCDIPPPAHFENVGPHVTHRIGRPLHPPPTLPDGRSALEAPHGDQHITGACPAA